MSTENGTPPGGLDRREAEGPVVADMHEPIYREMAEPREGYEPPPAWLIFFCLLVMGYGGWYLGMYSGALRADVYDEHPGAAVRVVRPAQQAPPDPMVLGRRIFNNCMACHQKDGRGLPGTYPPLDGSEIVNGRADVMAAIVLHGLEGPVTVHGETFNEVMPSWKHFTDQQLAAVMTYVRSSWSNRAAPVPPELVAAVREAAADRSGAPRAADLEALAAAPPVTAAKAEKSAKSDVVSR